MSLHNLIYQTVFSSVAQQQKASTKYLRVINQIVIKIINLIKVRTKVRAALIDFLDPTTALIEADAIRPAIVKCELFE